MRIAGYIAVSKGRVSVREEKEESMSVARVTEISATNSESFEAAINEGVRRATSTLRNVEGAWVKDMNVLISDNNIVGYKVNLAVTFVLEDAGEIS
jgi:flavin-binding protein dodecin